MPDSHVATGAGAPAAPQTLWWQYTRWPMLGFLLLATTCAFSNLDPDIASAVFFDANRQQWIGAHSWLTQDLIHAGGGLLLRATLVGAFVIWVLSFRRPSIRPYRRPTAYFLVATLLSVSVVGVLKHVTNIHCPWDLRMFGGSHPYVHLFAARPKGPSAQCFPAAHASSGYALLSLYFVFRERSRRLSLAGLGVGLVTGLIFGIAQQSRGAHFLSHDVWSLFLVWLTCTTVFTALFRASLWTPAPASALPAAPDTPVTKSS